MIRFLSPPGIFTGLVVMLSVASGVAFGAAVVGTGLMANAVLRRVRP